MSGSEAFESFEHAGMTCELHQDWEPMRPDEWDTLGTMVGFDSAAIADSRGKPKNAYQDEEAADKGSDVLRRYLSLCCGVLAVPFYFADYGSSGAHVYETDGDSKPSGYLYTTRARCDTLGVRWEAAEDQLRGELGEWDAYYAGEVVGYVVRDPAGEVVGSCWGFYPGGSSDPLEYVRSEARSAAEYEAAERDRAAAQDIATRAVSR